MNGRKLIVEGKTDRYFIEQVCDDVAISRQTFTIYVEEKEAEGISALLKKLPVTIESADPDVVLGIVIDADLNAGGRWERISQILVRQGYTIPKLLPQTGLVIESDGLLPRFGAWIMPNNQDEGILENFIRQLINEQDKLQPEVERILDELKATKRQLFPEVKRPKAFIKTWLAWQEDPEVSYGVAIKKKGSWLRSFPSECTVHNSRKLFKDIVALLTHGGEKTR